MNSAKYAYKKYLKLPERKIMVSLF